MPFSVSAGIGFIALFGIAVLNGIVLIEHLKDLKHEGMTKYARTYFTGTRDRLRPVILTAAAAAMGFLPMAISTGAGAEVQRPLATVVIGGLITSTMLTMIALPLLFEIFYNVKGIQLWPLRFIRSKSATIGLIFLIFSSTAFGQTKELSLDDAINLAIENNKELNAYFLKVKETEALIPTAYTIDKTNVFYGYDENNIADNGHPLNVFGVEQNFSFPTLYSAQRKLNKQSISIAQITLLRQTQLLTRNVSQTYYEIQYLLNKQNIYKEIDSMYSKYSKSASFRYEQGDISYMDLLNAQAIQQKINIQINELNYDLEIAYQKLQGIMQYDSAFAVPLQKLEIITAEIRDIESGSGVQMLNQQTEQEYAKLRVERNRLIPDISLSYFNGTNWYEGSDHYHGCATWIGCPFIFW